MQGERGKEEEEREAGRAEEEEIAVGPALIEGGQGVTLRRRIRRLDRQIRKRRDEMKRTIASRVRR